MIFLLMTMENAAPTSNGIYSFDDVTIDCQNFEVRKDGLSVDLKPRTFDVLVYLTANPGRVVSKQEIFDAIWKDTFVEDNALAKIICEIRHALSDDASKPRFIETVPKRGYRFVAEIKEPDSEQASETGVANPKTAFQTPAAAEPVSLLAKRAMLVLGIVAIAAFASWLLFGPTLQTTRSPSIRSVAVLPFVNESGNQEIEYLADGMTEMLIGSLARLPELSVKARSTVFRYKGKEIDAKTIGKELNVQALLIGRVSVRGDQLTLNLELIDLPDENAIWSQKYTRDQSDLLRLQPDIARDVSRSLRSKITDVDETKLDKTSTASPEAYQLYLRGRYHWNKRTLEGLKQAVEFFDEAIAKDPNFALAHSGLAETYVLYSFYGNGSPKESMPLAMAAARRALEIDDSLAEAHVALGLYNCLFAWNDVAAEKEFRRAIELNPNYPPAHQQLGNCCLNGMSRFDESIAEGKIAEELDPLSPIISADSVLNLYLARRFDEALVQADRAIALDPTFHSTYLHLASIYEAKGMYKEAVAAARKALAVNDFPGARAALARSLAKAGERREAAKLIDELEVEARGRLLSGNAMALAYSALGKMDKAIAWLEKDVAERMAPPAHFAISPALDDLRGDPRFTDLIRRVHESKLE